jgi:hypothetical protein
MVHPSVEFPNSVLDPEDSAVRDRDMVLAESKDRGPLPVPRAHEDGVSSPVCAACWAY